MANTLRWNSSTSSLGEWVLPPVSYFRTNLNEILHRYRPKIYLRFFAFFGVQHNLRAKNFTQLCSIPNLSWLLDEQKSDTKRQKTEGRWVRWLLAKFSHHLYPLMYVFYKVPKGMDGGGTSLFQTPVEKKINFTLFILKFFYVSLAEEVFFVLCFESYLNTNQPGPGSAREIN